MGKTIHSCSAPVCATDRHRHPGHPLDSRLPAEARAVFDSTAAECLRICAALGIDRICATGAFLPGRFSLIELQQGFHAFCDRAAAQGVRVELEFLPMRGVSDLATALAILGEAPPANAGLLVDAWHFFRSGSTLAELARIPSGLVRTIQLADAVTRPPGVDLLEDCLCFRRLPGEGELALTDWLAALAAQPIDDLGPEIFSLALDEMSATEAARRCDQSSRRVLEAASWQPRRR
jgi:4-hydroxyphenylpyruvate dioxygenase